MRLTELDAAFKVTEVVVESYTVVDGDQQTWNDRGRPTKIVTGPRTYLHTVQTLNEAHGIYFLCPLCYVKNKGPVGTHGLYIYFTGRIGIPETEGLNGEGKIVRWHATGTGLTDLTLTPSILVKFPCGWHGWITNGDIK